MLLLIGLLNDSAQAFDPSGFNHAATIRINGHSGSEVLTSFPVLLKFSILLEYFITHLRQHFVLSGYFLMLLY